MEHYLHFSGQKDALEIFPIVLRHADVFIPDAVRTTLAARDAAPDPAERRRATALVQAVAELCMERDLAMLADELATAQAQATVTVDGETMPYHSVAVAVQNEPASVTGRAVRPRARSRGAVSGVPRPTARYGRSITSDFQRPRRRIGSSRLARLSLVAAAANGVPPSSRPAPGDTCDQHEYRIESGDRDPGGRAEPGRGEGPGGDSFPEPPPADTQEGSPLLQSGPPSTARAVRPGVRCCL